MKKFIFLLIILSVFFIQCSNESSGESEIDKSQTDAEFIEDDIDNFVYEEVETNIVITEEKSKTVVKENKKNEVKTENKINETKTNEFKTVNESEETKVNENVEIKAENESTSESKINDAEKIVYISKTGKKYHLENCRTLRGEKEAIDLNEAIKTGYEACKICNPDSI